MLCYISLSILYRWRVELGRREAQNRRLNPAMCVYAHCVGTASLTFGVALVAVAVSGGLGISPELLVFANLSLEKRDLMVAMGAVLFILTALLGLIGTFAYQRYLRNSSFQNDQAQRRQGGLLSSFNATDEPRTDGDTVGAASDYGESGESESERDLQTNALAAEHVDCSLLFGRAFRRHLSVYALLLVNCLSVQLLLFGTMPWSGRGGAATRAHKLDSESSETKYWEIHSKYDFSKLKFSMLHPHQVPVAFTPAVYLIWGVVGSVAAENTGKCP